MMDRFHLIARKQEMRRQIEQLQRRLDAERMRTPPNVRQIRQMENELETLISQEYTLRLAIDRSR